MNTKHILTVTLSALLAFGTGQSYSQNEAKETPVQWYQIEVFIFDNNDESAAGNERWPQDLVLRYPPNTVELIDPLSLNAPTLNENDSLKATNNFQQFPTLNSNTATEASFSTVNPLHSGLTVEGHHGEIPYALLPDEELQLTHTVRKISRRNNFRKLFHHAWRQPAATRKDSPHIIITGGDKFDNHFELEGTIQLGVERYLHITTDLWLSSFVGNAGLERDLWSTLPKRPETNPQSTPSNAIANEFDPVQHSFLALFGNQYSVDRTVTLRQTRRMRSGELHYIDHPLIGLLVKVTPYELPIEEDTDITLDEQPEDISTSE